MTEPHNLDFLAQLLGEEPEQPTTPTEHPPTNGELFAKFVEENLNN